MWIDHDIIITSLVEPDIIDGTEKNLWSEGEFDRHKVLIIDTLTDMYMSFMSRVKHQFLWLCEPYFVVGMYSKAFGNPVSANHTVKLLT